MFFILDNCSGQKAKKKQTVETSMCIQILLNFSIYKEQTSKPTYPGTMGTRLQNKISVDVAADNSSLDSLSFAGLACIQDQQTKLPPNNAKHDREFKFSPPTPDKTALDQLSHTPADILISNGQLLPHTLLFQAQQSQIASHTYSRGSPQETQKNSKNFNKKNEGCTEDIRKANRGTNEQATKEYTSSSSWIGRKMHCVIFPCRECHATNPIAKAESKQGERK